MVIDWSKPISDVPDELVETVKKKFQSVLSALGYKPKMYEYKLGQKVHTAMADCCGASNYTIPGINDALVLFKGFAPFLSEKQMKDTDYRACCGKDKIDEYSIERKEFSYTDPETNETIYYTVAIQNALGGINISSAREDEEDDDEF